MENGLRCPSCFTFLKETCTPTQEALCVGEETRCVTMTGLMHPGEGNLDFGRRAQGSQRVPELEPHSTRF